MSEQNDLPLCQLTDIIHSQPGKAKENTEDENMLLAEGVLDCFTYILGGFHNGKDLSCKRLFM